MKAISRLLLSLCFGVLVFGVFGRGFSDPSLASEIMGKAKAAAVNAPWIEYSSYLGGNLGGGYAEDNGFSMAMDNAGFVYLAGSMASTNYPCTHYFGPTNAQWGAFVAKIDPARNSIVYLTFLAYGRALSLALDQPGNVYIAGDCGEYFPTTTNAVNLRTQRDGRDAFAAKLSPDGAQLLYSTLLGGSGSDMGRGMVVDASGRAWVTGWTSSTNFPVSANAWQPALAGDYDLFLTQLDAAGSSLLFSSYLGGEQRDFGASLAADATGNLYLAGWTQSERFSINPRTYRIGTGGWQNALLAKINPQGPVLEYLTLIGGTESQSAASVALDKAGSAFLFGLTDSTNFPVTANCLQPNHRGAEDHFVLKLNPEGRTLAYSTYLGGSGREDLTYPEYWEGDTLISLETAGLVLDAEGNAYVAGVTASEDLAPAGVAINILGGYYDGYVAKINADGTALKYVVYLGGTSWDMARALALDGKGGVYVTGTTGATPIPPYFQILPGAMQTQYGGGTSDAFLVKINEAPFPSDSNKLARRRTLSGYRQTVQESNATTGSNSMWWTWTAPSDGQLALSTEGSTFDTLLAVYSGTNLTQLTQVAVNDDESADRQTSRVKFPVTAGTTYLIAVDGKDGATGGITLSLTLSVPVNDDFAGRIRLTNRPPVLLAGTNVNATFEPAEAYHDHAGFYGGHSVWWEWTSPISGNVAVSTLGSDFDTMLAIYTNSVWNDLALLTSNDNYTNNLFTSQVNFQAQKGAVYQIVVDGVWDTSGSIRLNILPGEPPPNDNFTNRILLTGWATNVTSHNMNTTPEPGEPALGFYYPAGSTVWWSWTAPTNGRVAITTEGSSFDTQLGVFTGDALANLTLVASNDNVGNMGRIQSAARVNFEVKSNLTYQIMVGGSGWDGLGEIKLGLRFYHPFYIGASALKRLADGSFQFPVRGWPDTAYAIEASTNLLDWSALPSGALQGDAFIITDPDAPRFRQRYYRVIESP